MRSDRDEFAAHIIGGMVSAPGFTLDIAGEMIGIERARIAYKLADAMVAASVESIPCLSKQHDMWDQIGKRVMEIPGMDRAHDDSFIAEPTDASRTYIKFMSDKGVTDDANGIIFATYMRSKGYTVDVLRPRSCIVRTVDMIKEFSV